MGPLVGAEHLERVLSYVEIGRREATLVAGGRVSGDPALARGFFVEPAVFADMSPNAHRAGGDLRPVLTVLTFYGFDDALRVANHAQYALASAVWSRDIRKALTFASAFAPDRVRELVPFRHGGCSRAARHRPRGVRLPWLADTHIDAGYLIYRPPLPAAAQPDINLLQAVLEDVRKL
jgi:hypothetical protein